MSELLDEIRRAQILAGEQVVIDRLKKSGFMDNQETTGAKANYNQETTGGKLNLFSQERYGGLDAEFLRQELQKANIKMKVLEGLDGLKLKRHEGDIIEIMNKQEVADAITQKMIEYINSKEIK